MADAIVTKLKPATRRVAKSAVKSIVEQSLDEQPADAPIAAPKPRRVAKPAAVTQEIADLMADPAPHDVTPAMTAEQAPAEPVTAAAAAIPLAEAAPIMAGSAHSKGPDPMTDTTVTEAVEDAKTVTAETVKNATAKMTEALQDMTAKAKTAMEKLTEMSKDAVEFNKANMEAMVESGKVAVKGAQTAAQNAADYGRKNIHETTEMVKSIGTVKAPADLLKIQGDFARSQFDAAVAELSKSTEFYLKLAGEVFQPISTRYSVVAEDVKSRMAK